MREQIQGQARRVGEGGGGWVMAAEYLASNQTFGCGAVADPGFSREGANPRSRGHQDKI